MISCFKVLAITCARGRSNGVPHKNIKSIAGKPLLAWTIQEAKKSKYIDKYVVSTDDPDIADVARSYGVDVIARPTELAEDKTPIRDVLLHAMDMFPDFEYVVDIRTTNPLKTVNDIDGCIETLFKGGDMVCGVSRVEDQHPSRVKRIVNGVLVDFWPENTGNRQDLKPPAFIRNGSVYVSWADHLRQRVDLYFSGDNIRPWVMPPERSVNIDTPYDFLVAEAMLNAKL